MYHFRNGLDGAAKDGWSSRDGRRPDERKPASPLESAMIFSRSLWWKSQVILRRKRLPQAVAARLVHIALLIAFVVLSILWTHPEMRKVKRAISLRHPLSYVPPMQKVSSLGNAGDQVSLKSLGRSSRTVYLILAHDGATVAGVDEMLMAMWQDERPASDFNWSAEDRFSPSMPGDLFLIHIDSRTRESVFAPLKKWTTRKRHRVIILPKEYRKSSAWGGFGLVDAQLSLIKAAVDFAPKHFGQPRPATANAPTLETTSFDYAVLLDGSTFPLTARMHRQDVLNRLPLHVNVFNMEAFSPYYISRVPWLGPRIDCLLGPPPGRVGPSAMAHDDDRCLYFSGTPFNGVIVKHDQWAILASPTAMWMTNALQTTRSTWSGGKLPQDLRPLSGSHPASSLYFHQWLDFMRRTKIWATDEIVLGTLIYNAAPPHEDSDLGNANSDALVEADLGGPSRLGPSSILNSPSLLFTKWGKTCKTYANRRIPFSPCYLGTGDLDELLDEKSQFGTGRDWRDDMWFNGASPPALNVLHALKGQHASQTVAGMTDALIVRLPIRGAAALFARKFSPADSVKAELMRHYT